MAGLVGGAFERLGEAVGTRPWLTIALALVVVVACSSGISQLTIEERQENLWVPKDTEAQRDKAWIEAQGYPKSPRIEYLILEAPPALDASQGDVLTPEMLGLALRVHEEVGRTTGTVGGEAYGTEDVCEKRGASCFAINVLEAFNYTAAAFDTREKILAVLNQPEVTTAEGRTIDLEQVLGSLRRDAQGRVVGAKALALLYFLENNEELGPEGGWIDPPAEAWEEEYLKLAETAPQAEWWLEGVSVYRFSERTFSDEFGGAIEGDLKLLYGAIMFIIVYAVVMLSRWSRPCCQGLRLGLTLAGVACIGGAFTMAMGICSYAGLFYSPLMSVAPFLLLGIGVDDMFVIVSQFDLQDPALPVPKRLGRALRDAGASITVTSLTDFFAFLIGSNTTLPALRVFSYYVAAAIMFDYVLQVTAFCAVLALDARRMEGDRLDCLCCVRRPRRDPEAGGCGGGGCCGCSCGEDDAKANRAFARYAKFLTKRWVRAAVVVVFAGVLAGGAYGLSQIQVEADEKNFIPAGSYALDFYEANDLHFSSVGDPSNVYLTDSLDYASPEGWASLREVCAAFRNSTDIAPDTVSCWFEAFEASRGGELSQERFYADLDAFLAADGSRFSSDLVRDNSTGRVATSRFTGQHVKTKNSQERIDAMDSVRADVEAAGGFGADARVFGFFYLNVEQFKAIEQEAIRNIGFALLMVFIIIALLIIQPLGVVITFVCIGMTVVEIIGYVHFWGTNIDSVSVIVLVISLGLSVDYCVHVGHAFIVKGGSPEARLEAAMSEMGTAVFNGAFSTFLSVLLLSASSSYVFITIFKVLFLCTTLSLGHGLVLLPTLMYTFPPPTLKVD